MSYYREQLEEFLKEIDVKADTVLDIGGKQGEVKNRVKSWNVKNYAVLDLPDYDLQENWSLRHYGLKEKANVVFCLEVFEYLIDPLQAIKNIDYVLKDNTSTRSVAYISVPLVYPMHNETDLDSLRYTETAMNRLCKKVQLEITRVWERKAKNELLTSYYATDGMRMAKGWDHHITGYLFEVTK